ncbi:MAG TPA: cupin domain-containing protein [Solirubrobacteraceae bacterium]|nr:cupin domain-containing protein [Solirubrobacteraceae bacterium]
MQKLSIATPQFEYEDAPSGYNSGGVRLGKALGANETGATVYELPPGEALCPYHYERSEEEWLVVFEGTPTLRHPGGSERLDPWDVVFFPIGPEGAHKVSNETDQPVRFLMFSTVKTPAVCVYPDSGKIGVFTGEDIDSVIVRRSSNVDYWDGETG